MYIQNFHINPLSESALVLSFGNIINININQKITRIYQYFKANPFEGLVDIVPAYSSICFQYDPVFIHQNFKPETSVFNWVKNIIETSTVNILEINSQKNELIKIPFCVDNYLDNDLHFLANKLQLPEQEIIEIFLSKTYQVFMLGFLPGFAYMGEVSPKLFLPRKQNPTKVKMGAVAIAGKQTGIYPLNSFGGWHILGYTPIKMFNKENQQQPSYLKAGQLVQFHKINLKEYQQFITQ